MSPHSAAHLRSAEGLYEKAGHERFGKGDESI